MTKLVLLVGCLFVSAPAIAQISNIVLNAPEPAAQNDQNTAQFDLYYAGGAIAAPSPGFIDSAAGFRWHNTSSGVTRQDENVLLVDIQLVKQNAFALTGTERIAVSFSINATTGTEIPIEGAGIRSGTSVPTDCVAGSNCQSADGLGDFYAARYTVNSVLRVALSVERICTAAVAAGAAGTLCTGAAYSTLGQTTPQMLVQNITVNFNKLADDSVVKVEAGSTGKESKSFNLYVSSIAPGSDCQSATEADLYFPGDQSVILNTSALNLDTNSGPPIQNIVFLGKKGSAPVDASAGLNSTSGNTISRVAATNATTTITGLVNSTSAGDTGYQARIHAQNRAGLISDLVSTAETCTPGFELKAQPISGILTESKCFIATAAYQNGKAPPVRLLRKFRDRVLAPTSLGKKFIDWYYAWSPEAARWAWNKPMIRALSRKLLTPIEVLAWITLKWQSAMTSEAQAQQNEAQSSSPYLDRLKKQVQETSTPSEMSYSEQEKKKLLEESKSAETAESPEGYSERERAKLKENPDEPRTNVESSTGYSEKMKSELPATAERANPSELVKKGLDRKLGRGDVPPIKNAASFRFGISPGMTVQVEGGSALNTFENIYGGGWQPELFFHFERQLFHSENLGSFGLTGDFGLSYAEGFGRLRFDFNGTTISRTKFSFVQVPLLVGANYRFNLFRILRPYAGAGVGTMLYTEIRQDEQPDKRGYSFIYNVHGGLALLMDFLDSGSARDSYLTMGIQHTYLFLEYFNLNTLSGNVRFARSGIYSGFLFEF